MERTSTANDLTDRLRKRLESERREIEELTASELRKLAEHSRRVARSALGTIERDTEEAVGKMRELLLKAWQRPLIVGLSLWLGFFGGSWATMRWLATSIQDRIETLGELDTRTEWARKMLAEIEETTWGVELMEDSGERWVSLPAGTPVRTAFTMDGRPYLKLSRD